MIQSGSTVFCYYFRDTNLYTNCKCVCTTCMYSGTSEQYRHIEAKRFVICREVPAFQTFKIYTK